MALRTGAVEVTSSHFTDEELRVPGVTFQRSHCEEQGREGSPGNFPPVKGLRIRPTQEVQGEDLMS